DMDIQSTVSFQHSSGSGRTSQRCRAFCWMRIALLGTSVGLAAIPCAAWAQVPVATGGTGQDGGSLLAPGGAAGTSAMPAGGGGIAGAFPIIVGGGSGAAVAVVSPISNRATSIRHCRVAAAVAAAVAV